MQQIEGVGLERIKGIFYDKINKRKWLTSDKQGLPSKNQSYHGK